MTQRRNLSNALLVGFLLAGCSVEDKIDPNGQGSDYSGGGGVEGEASDTDMNTPGPDMDDEGVNVQPTYPTQHPRIYISANKARSWRSCYPVRQ